jgi:hypothetical protein
MATLRVWIVREGVVVDVEEFEDPRAKYVEEFNRLNQETPFRAVLASLPPSDRQTSVRSSCRPKRNCRESHV